MTLLSICLAGLLSTANTAHADDSTADTVFTYPEARRGDVVDDYHGVRVPDPYRWLEQPDSEETRTWVNAQVDLTTAFLEDVPRREAIRERMQHGRKKAAIGGSKSGKPCNRPKLDVDVDGIAYKFENGMSMNQIAKEYEVSITLVRSRLQERGLR